MKNHINPFYTLLLVSVILFASCAKDKKNELEFFNDLENVKGWTGGKNNEESIVKGTCSLGPIPFKNRFDISIRFRV